MLFSHFKSFNMSVPKKSKTLYFLPIFTKRSYLRLLSSKDDNYLFCFANIELEIVFFTPLPQIFTTLTELWCAMLSFLNCE